jgi:hypothetical protein
LHVDVFKMLEFSGEGGLERAFELLTELRELSAVGFGPGGLTFGEDEAVVTQDPGDPVPGAGGVALIGIAEPEQPSQSLLLLGGDVDGGEVAATVEPGEHDGVEPIGLAMIAGFSWDEGGCDDVAVEPVVSEYAVENEAGTGCFVARPDGRLFGETTEEPSDLHEVAGERKDLRLSVIALEDGGGDRIGVHVETNPCILVHGWIPPEKMLECQSHSCSSGQRYLR